MEQKENPSLTGSPEKEIVTSCTQGWRRIFYSVVNCFSRFRNVVSRFLWPRHRFEEYEVEIDNIETSSTTSGATTMSGFTITALEDPYVSFPMGDENFDHNLGGGDGKVIPSNKVGKFEKYATLSADFNIGSIGIERNIARENRTKPPEGRSKIPSASKYLPTAARLENTKQKMSPIKECSSKSVSENQDVKNYNNPTTSLAIPRLDSLENLMQSCTEKLPNVEKKNALASLNAIKDFVILNADQENDDIGETENPLMVTKDALYAGVEELTPTLTDIKNPRVPTAVDMKTSDTQTYVIYGDAPIECDTEYNVKDTPSEIKKAKDCLVASRNSKFAVTKETVNDNVVNNCQNSTNGFEKDEHSNVAENMHDHSKAASIMSSVRSALKSTSMSPPTPSGCVSKHHVSESFSKTKACVTKLLATSNWHESNIINATSNDIHGDRKIEGNIIDPILDDKPNVSAKHSNFKPGSKVVPVLNVDDDQRLTPDHKPKISHQREFTKPRLTAKYGPRNLAMCLKDNKPVNNVSKQSVDRHVLANTLDREISTIEQQINVLMSAKSIVAKSDQRKPDVIENIAEGDNSKCVPVVSNEFSTQLRNVTEKHSPKPDPSKSGSMSKDECEFITQHRKIVEKRKQPKSGSSQKSSPSKLAASSTDPYVLAQKQHFDSSDILKQNQQSGKNGKDETMVEIKLKGFPNEKIMKLIGRQLAQTTIKNKTHILNMEQIQVGDAEVTFKAEIEERVAKSGFKLPMRKRKSDITRPKSLRVSLCGDQETGPRKPPVKNKELKVTVRRGGKVHDIPVSLATSSRLLQSFIDQPDNRDLQHALGEYVLQTAIPILSDIPDSTRNVHSVVDEAMSSPLSQNNQLNSSLSTSPPRVPTAINTTASPISTNKDSSHPTTAPPKATSPISTNKDSSHPTTAPSKAKSPISTNKDSSHPNIAPPSPPISPPPLPMFVPTNNGSSPLSTVTSASSMSVPLNKDSSHIRHKPKFQRRVIPKLIPRPFGDFQLTENPHKLLAGRERKSQHLRDDNKVRPRLKSHADKSTNTQHSKITMSPISQQSQSFKQFNHACIGFIPRNEKCIQVDLPSQSSNSSKRDGDGCAFSLGLHHENFDIGTYRIDGHISAEKTRKGQMPEEKRKIKTRGIPNKHLDKSVDKSFNEDVNHAEEEATVFGNPDAEESFSEDHQKLSFMEGESITVDSRHNEALPFTVLHDKKRVNEPQQTKGKNKKRKHVRTSTGPESKKNISVETFFKYSEEKQKLRH